MALAACECAVKMCRTRGVAVPARWPRAPVRIPVPTMRAGRLTLGRAGVVFGPVGSAAGAGAFAEVPAAGAVFAGAAVAVGGAAAGGAAAGGAGGVGAGGGTGSGAAEELTGAAE